MENSKYELKRILKPVRGCPPVTLGFGEVYQGAHHTGIDYGVPEGTPVYAVSDGVVMTSGYQQGGYGWHVILIHPDGSGSVYAHLCKRGLYPGSSVVAGAVIGHSGNTGNSSGPHLHFEYRGKATSGQSVVDPEVYYETPDVQTTYKVLPYTGVSPQQSYAVRPVALKSDLQLGAAKVVCDVANVRNSSMEVVGTIKRGAPVVITSQKVMFNGLPFYKATVLKEVYIAAHDGETQILAND